MNQKGEITMLIIFFVLSLSSLLIYCAQSLELNFNFLKQRTNLIICSKKSIIEIKRHINYISKTNWALKNINRFKTFSSIFPGIVLTNIKIEKIKFIIKNLQEIEFLKHLKNLSQIKKNRCEMNTETFLTPFKHDQIFYQRGKDETVLARKESWQYKFTNAPFSIHLNLKTLNTSHLHPKFSYILKDKLVTFQSIWLSGY